MSTGNSVIKLEDAPHRALMGTVMAHLETVRAAIKQQNMPNLELARRFRDWRRKRAIGDFHAKLDRLSDKQLNMLGLDRLTLDLDVEALYDRYYEETAELKQLTADIEPIEEARQLTAA